MIISNRASLALPKLNLTTRMRGPVDRFKLAWYFVAIFDKACACSSLGVDDKSTMVNGTLLSLLWFICLYSDVCAMKPKRKAS